MKMNYPLENFYCTLKFAFLFSVFHPEKCFSQINEWGKVYKLNGVGVANNRIVWVSLKLESMKSHVQWWKVFSFQA